MITATAIQFVKPEKEDELISLMQDLTNNVKANEPGCTLFEYVRSKGKAHTYLVIEQYKDNTAFDYHHGTPYLKAFIPKMMNCLSSEPEITLYEDALAETM